MKNIFLVIVVLLGIAACNQPLNKTEKELTVSGKVDNSVVNVYYFHGKQRCKTCIAVGDVTKQTVEKNFQGNNNVVFKELNTEDEVNATLIEKYDVSWNALIIAKGEQHKNITEDAFSVAVDNPEKLSSDIVKIVKSMLEEK